MSALRQAAVLWGLALIPAVFTGAFQLEWKRDEGKVDLASVRSWSEPVLWVDARSRNRYESEHWPDAVLLNLDEWDTLVPGFLAVWNPDVRIVVYCDTASCGASREVAQKIRADFGHEAVWVLDGGWETLERERR